MREDASKEGARFFAVLAAIGGLFFMSTSMTGNVIRDQSIQSSPMGMLSLLLFLCAGVLALYTILKKE